jgi:SAM-dependent methyltransferase
MEWRRDAAPAECRPTSDSGHWKAGRGVAPQVVLAFRRTEADAREEFVRTSQLTEMKPVRLLAGVAVIAFTALLSTGPVAGQQPAAEPRRPDVIYVPTPQKVVDAMLETAKVTKDDVVYDLGCGDGRIVITAAKLGARGVGIDIDPQRIKEARENAKTAGVEDRVQFLETDLFTTDISKATVVTLYLLPSLNMKLQPKLLDELKPGTRVVSHAFDMGDWEPEQTKEIESRMIYFWTIPPRPAR